MKRHRLDLISLFFGLTFVAIGGVFISGDVDVTDIDWEVTWPLPLIAGGLMMLAAALRAMSRAEEEPVPAGAGHTQVLETDEIEAAAEYDVEERRAPEANEEDVVKSPNFASEDPPSDDEPQSSVREKQPPRP